MFLGTQQQPRSQTCYKLLKTRGVSLVFPTRPSGDRHEVVIGWRLFSVFSMKLFNARASHDVTCLMGIPCLEFDTILVI